MINESRGADRFHSLFELLDLEDRIISKNSNFGEKIDYKKSKSNFR